MRSFPASRLPRPTWAFFAALALLAIAGGGLLFYATPQGLGLNDDSIAYVAGARSLLEGRGYREIWIVSAGPVTHFPPGFPTTLAFTSLVTGIDPLRAARLLNVLLFVFNTFLMGWLALRMTKSRVVGLLTAALFLLTPSLLKIHSNAMSEPLYVFFTLVTFLLLDFYFYPHPLPLREAPQWGSRIREWGWGEGLLLAAGLITSLAFLTRYAALALLATGVVALVIMHSEWRKRLVSAGIYLAGFVPFVVAWTIRNRIVGGTVTNRAIDWHPIVESNARTGIRTFSEFLVPIQNWQLSLIKVDGLFEVILIALALGLLVWTLKVGLPRFFQPEKNSQPEVISFLNGLYIFGYFLSLVVTMTFFDPATKFQLRIVSPMLVSLLLLLAFGLKTVAGPGPGRRIALGLTVILFAVSAVGMSESLVNLRRGGQVYANERWYDAPAIAALRELPADVVIHSNQPGVIYLYVGRPGALLPGSVEAARELQEEVRAGRAVIVIFRDANAEEATLAYYEALGQGLQVEKYNGDVIYSAP
ncbi:MAG: phospholipid carrier-dependent glycosyltransferase [Chloroflexi bacterium]|nr:phospholipid carrier-dependent glycosyltransferase [Chloroflexota bacterium]